MYLYKDVSLDNLEEELGKLKDVDCCPWVIEVRGWVNHWVRFTALVTNNEFEKLVILVHEELYNAMKKCFCSKNIVFKRDSLTCDEFIDNVVMSLTRCIEIYEREKRNRVVEKLRALGFRSFQV